MNEAIVWITCCVAACMLGFNDGISHAQSNMAEECRLVGATRIDGTVFMCNKVNSDH